MSESEALGLGVFTVLALACYTTFFAAFFLYAGAETLGAGGAVLALVALVVLFVASLLAYTIWECNFGSAFSYFFPLHGSQRLRHQTWRFGTLIKTSVLGLLVALLVRTILVRDIAVHINGVRVLSPLSTLDALLVPLCLAFPSAALLLYALGAHFNAPQVVGAAASTTKAQK